MTRKKKKRSSLPKRTTTVTSPALHRARKSREKDVFRKASQEGKSRKKKKKKKLATRSPKKKAPYSGGSRDLIEKRGKKNKTLYEGKKDRKEVNHLEVKACSSFWGPKSHGDQPLKLKGGAGHWGRGKNPLGRTDKHPLVKKTEKGKLSCGRTHFRS